MWASFADQELYLQPSPVGAALTGATPFIKELVEEKEALFKRALGRLEVHFEEQNGQGRRKWLVREDEWSLADLSVAGGLYWAFKFWVDKEFRKDFPRLMEWWERLMQEEVVGKAYRAPLVMCETRPVVGNEEGGGGKLSRNEQLGFYGARIMFNLCRIMPHNGREMFLSCWHQSHTRLLC